MKTQENLTKWTYIYFKKRHETTDEETSICTPNKAYLVKIIHTSISLQKISKSESMNVLVLGHLINNSNVHVFLLKCHPEYSEHS